MDERLTLTRAQRRDLERSARRFKREKDAWLDDVATHIAGRLFDEPERFDTGDLPAIAISDYAYSLAAWVCPEEFR
jgi:hypothetical protein